MYKLAMLVNSRLVEFANLYVTQKGIEGGVDDAVMTAGLAGQLCCFPQLDGSNTFLYGFAACVYPADSERPFNFWVVLPDLEMPEVHLIRPLSWAEGFKARSILTSAEYAVARLIGELKESVEKWPSLDMVTRLDILANILAEEPWNTFVKDLIPTFAEHEDSDRNEGAPKSQIDKIVVSFTGGGYLSIDSDPKHPWPKLMDLGTMKTTRMVKTGKELVPHDEYFEYIIPSVGWA